MLTGWSWCLHDYITSKNPGLLASAWQAAFDRKVVAAAVAAVDKDSCEIPDQWSGVTNLIAKPTVEDELLLDALMVHADVLRQELINAGAARQSNAQLREKLRQAAVNGFGVAPPPLNAPFPRLWPRIAGKIASTAFGGYAADRQNWRAYALLALAGYVQALSTTDLAATAKTITRLAQRSVLGMRGAVTRLPHEVHQDSIVDSLNASTSTLWHHLPGHSRFLMEADVAVDKVRRGGGFMSAFLDPNLPVNEAHRSAAASLSPQAIAAIRRAIYLQYDSLVVGMLAYSGLEQLLRSRMQRLGLPHRMASGRPYPVLDWLGKLAIPPTLDSLIREVYDPLQANTRNRLWHSCFLMIDQCRPEIVRAIQNGVPYTPGPHYPETMARQATRLVAAVAQLWGVPDIDLGWTSASPLTPKTEIELGSLSWELDGSDLLGHQDQFRLFVDNVAPALSSLFKRGLVSSISNPPIEQLAALVLVFEGLLRHTFELMNIATVDLYVSPTRQTTNVKMLDSSGLLARVPVEALLAPIPPRHRPSAEALLNIVVDFRNMFAHGAIRAISMTQRELLGRSIVKLAYLCGSVGLRHMIGERAHYLYRKDDQGSPEANWLAGESDIIAWLRARLDALNALQPLPCVQRIAI